MWKGRVGSLVAPCDRRGRDEVEIHLVFGVSREPVQPVRPPRQETLFLADSSRLRAARLPCPRFSLSWFLFPPDPYGIVSLSRSRPWRADRRCPCRRILLRFRYSSVFSLSFSPPDVSPYAPLARPWKEKLGIKWVPSTARGIIIHAEERNASPC